MAEAAHQSESPFRDLFRTTLIRCWSRPAVSIALGLMLAVMCLQLLTGFAVVFLLTSAAAENRVSVFSSIVKAQQWNLSWAFAFFRMTGLNRNWVIPSGSFSDPVVLALDILQTGVTAFLPVLAAFSVAPQLERRRLHARFAKGLNSLEVVAAQGLGALAPVFAVSFGLQLAWMGLWMTADPPEPIPILLWANGWAAGAILIRGGLLVCVSALCSRLRTAVMLCCGITFFALPLLTVILAAPPMLWALPDHWGLVSSFGPLVSEVLLFTFLLPRAVAHLNPNAHAEVSSDDPT